MEMPLSAKLLYIINQDLSLLASYDKLETTVKNLIDQSQIPKEQADRLTTKLLNVYEHLKM